MNIQEIWLTIAIILCVVLPVAIIAYDRIRHRKYYKQNEKIVILRLNNPVVRKQVREAGIDLCPCAREFRNTYLYTSDGITVCGFNENRQHIISAAIRKCVELVDCGNDVLRFIQEVQYYHSPNNV